MPRIIAYNDYGVLPQWKYSRISYSCLCCYFLQKSIFEGFVLRILNCFILKCTKMLEKHRHSSRMHKRETCRRFGENCRRELLRSSAIFVVIVVGRLWGNSRPAYKYAILNLTRREGQSEQSLQNSWQKNCFSVSVVSISWYVNKNAFLKRV